MNNLNLICESALTDLDIIVEQDNTKSNEIIRIHGPFVVCDKKNGNGRVYSIDLMKPVIENYTRDFIKTKRSVGELNHPESSDIDYNNACHLIEKFDLEGNDFIGTSKVLLGTPKGDLLGGLLKNGVTVGISTRGVGQVNESTNNVENYTLICADIVYNPSGQNAFVDGILESKKYMIDNHGLIVEQAYSNIENDIKIYSKHSKQEQFVKAIKKFLDSF